MRDISFNDVLQGFAQPLETWSKLRRLSVAIGIAWLTFTAINYLWAAAQTVSDATRHNAIAKLTARVQTAATNAAALPALRQRAKALITEPAADDALLDDVRLWQTFAIAIASSGLAFERFSPGSITTHADWRERSLKLHINGSFASLANFAAHLANLPFPVVPISVQLSTQKNGLLSLEAVLRIIGVPHQIKMPTTTRATLEKLSNPFQEGGTISSALSPSTFTSAPWQLVGVLRQGLARAALVQSSSGFLLLHIGDVVDGSVVARIEDKALLFTSRQGSRTLSLRE